MSEEMQEALRDALTPQWIKDFDPIPEERLPELAGELMGLLDHCRRHMPAEEWEYVLSQLAKWKKVK